MQNYKCQTCGEEFQQNPPPVCPKCRTIFVSKVDNDATKVQIEIISDLEDVEIEVIYQKVLKHVEENRLASYITRETLRTLLIELRRRGVAEIKGLGFITYDGSKYTFHNDLTKEEKINYRELLRRARDPMMNADHDPMDPFSSKSLSSYMVTESMIPTDSDRFREFYSYLVEEKREFDTEVNGLEENQGAFSALYYPYMEIIDEITLKNLLLYFDNIYLIAPNNPYKSFLRVISPRLFVNSDYTTLIRENIKQDAADPNLQRLSRTTSFKYWKLHREKASLFYELARETRGRVRASNKTYEDSEHDEDKIPFLPGESFMISLSLCACQRYNLVPVTDDPLHFKFLSYRLKRLSEDQRVIDTLRSHQIIKVKRSLKTALVVRQLLAETLPDLGGIKLKKLLEFRKEHRDELHQFRVEMARLATMVQAQIWESQLEEEVLDLIDSQIKPLLLDLKMNLQDFAREFISNRVTSIQNISTNITSSGIPFIMSLFAGLPMTAALGIGLGSLSLSNLIEYYTKKRGIRAKNTLTYLFDLRGSQWKH